METYPKKLLEAITEPYKKMVAVNANWRAIAVMSAIQSATTRVQKDRGGVDVFLKIPYPLAMLLAACTTVALEYSNDEEIDWERHDNILSRVVTQFLFFLVLMLRGEKYWTEDEETYIGNFIVPKFVLEIAKNPEIFPDAK